MPCDRCGGRLVEYELQGRVSTVCEECESIDVLVEHEPQSRPSESWDEALDRFHERSQQSDDADAAVATRTTETEQDPDPAPSGANTDDQSGDGSGSDALAEQDDPAAPADEDDPEGNDRTSRRRQAIKKVPRE